MNFDALARKGPVYTRHEPWVRCNTVLLIKVYPFGGSNAFVAFIKQ